MPKKRLLPRGARSKLGRLLNMLYAPSELADELGLPVRVVYRRFIPAGLPHQRDDKGRLWIPGAQAVEWFRRRKRQRVTLGPDEAYCFICKRAAPLINPRRGQQLGFAMLRAPCPYCGHELNRGVKR